MKDGSKILIKYAFISIIYIMLLISLVLLEIEKRSIFIVILNLFISVICIVLSFFVGYRTEKSNVFYVSFLISVYVILSILGKLNGETWYPISAMNSLFGVFIILGIRTKNKKNQI